jgi:phosphoglycolate phosphatase
MNYRAVLFDFDYTLADSSRGIEDCVNHALAELGLPAASARAVSETVGLSLAETFCRLTGPATPEQCAEFSRHFIARADHVMVDSTMLYDTARTVIPDLTQRGLAIGVLSTKFRRRIAAVLEREKMCGYFDVIVGGEDVANHKPHPEGALKAVEALGAAASEILYVGDSVVDAETARRAQLPFAAVLTGVTSRHAFTSYRPVAVIDTLTAVPGLVSSNSARASK